MELKNIAITLLIIFFVMPQCDFESNEMYDSAKEASENQDDNGNQGTQTTGPPGTPTGFNVGNAALSSLTVSWDSNGAGLPDYHQR